MPNYDEHSFSIDSPFLTGRKHGHADLLNKQLQPKKSNGNENRRVNTNLLNVK